uniref:Nuclear pore complex protein Nup155 n=1 Tax=Lygus hesperus TaxID=30085 RepID=A0A0A9XMF7_LYGHE
MMGYDRLPVIDQTSFGPHLQQGLQATSLGQQQLQNTTPIMSGNLSQSYGPQSFPGGLPPPVLPTPSSQPNFTAPSQMLKPSDPSFDLAERMIDKFYMLDNMLPSLIDKMKITPESGVTASGVFDAEYPSPLDQPGQVQVNQLKIINKVPLPSEIVEQIGTINQNTLMGLFPEISRSWLAIDSDIYIWNFETGGDVSYYDGMNSAICSVGLVKPKPNVFQDFVSRLLVLSSPSEIIVVGVILAPVKGSNELDELQLTPEVIYTLPTDGVPIKVIKGTDCGRIFLGGRDGCLYEIVYQKEISWLGKRARKVNHSRSSLSFLVPAFVSGAFSSNESLVDIVVDGSRNILYTLGDQGTIEAYDLGPDGSSGPSKVASVRHCTLESFTRVLTTRLKETGACPPTADVGKLTPVIALVTLSEADSPHLGVVGVTADGVRLYFSTGSPPPHRPSTLRLLHIRYPPPAMRSGDVVPFTSNINNMSTFQPTASASSPTSPVSPGRYNNFQNATFGQNSEILTSCYHKSGTFLFATTNVSTAEDKLWCLSPDYFPLKPIMSEDLQYHSLNAAAMLIGEFKTNSRVLDPFSAGHILQYQQSVPSNRFVILTPQGTEVYEKLRPVDILAEILRERNGPDCEEVKHYFMELGNDQACAMALIIACAYQNQTNHTKLVEWATRAFFLYGGDPKEMIHPMHQMTHHFGSVPQSFRPNQVSTPLGGRDQMHYSPNVLGSPIGSPAPGQVDNFGIQLSSKHNALYLYLVRIIRPLWSEKCVAPLHVKENKIFYTSSVTGTGVCRLTSRLLALKHFLEQNAARNDIFSNAPIGRDHLDRTASPGMPLRIQEKSSLDALKAFIDHATQVFGLWKVLCQHQIHLVINALPQEDKNMLLVSTYRDLVLCGKDLCSSLINTVINLYLNQCASVDSLSSKLREVCPSLYKTEDATCTKVNEILMGVKDVTDSDQKFRLLRNAIQLCKEVLPHMNHSSVCKQLVQHKYYDGVIEVCRDAANKVDPHNLAGSFVAKNQRPEDQAGSKAYLNRCNAYKDLATMLDDLFIKCQMGNNTISFDGLSPTQKVLEEVITKCLALEDEAAHMVVYDWLVTRNLQASLVKFGQPSLERYLLHYPPDNALRDLLWQYHERAGNHARAAQILYQLATSRGDSIKLHQRQTYLGKAVMCMRSDGVGCAPNLGVFLHELEDMVQVARVQKQVLDKITGLASSRAAADEAIKKLNSNLLSITELFTDFAEPFNLWECKLTILDVAGHDDQELIKNIWDEIIKEELDQCTSSSPDEQMLVVMSKVKSLGLQFTIQSPCFPVYYLVWQLELLSCRLNVNKSHVHSIMLSIDVPVVVLLDIYDKMFVANEHCWINEGNEFHLIQVIASFADSFTNNTRIVAAHERRAIAVQFQDLITSCLSNLYTKRETAQLVSYLKTIQTNLNRI